MIAVADASKEKSERRPIYWPWILTFLTSLVFISVLFDWFYVRCWIGLNPNEIGDTIAGFAGILAFIWLIAGYKLQQRELELNTKAVQQQSTEIAASVEQLRNQSKSLHDTQLFTKRDVLLKIIERKEGEIETAAIRFVRNSEKYGDDIRKQFSNHGVSLSDACIYMFTRKIFSDGRASSWLSERKNDEDLLIIQKAFIEGQEFCEQMEDDGATTATYENGICGDIYRCCSKFLGVDVKFVYRGVK